MHFTLVNLRRLEQRRYTAREPHEHENRMRLDDLSHLPSYGAVAAALLLAGCSSGPDDEGKTLGFAIIGWTTAVYETKYMDECPEGLAIGNDEIWWTALDPEVRARLTNDGTIEPVTASRRAMAGVRGPNGEDVCWNPEVVKDPPLRTVQGPTSFGKDLDGDSTGNPTPKSCKHTNFVSPSGAPGVDNQLYRLMGCHYGWRRHGYVDSNANGERRDTSHGITLVEVSGVDDMQNDDDVRVAFYKKRDGDVLHKDHTGMILANASYRIDLSGRYGATTRGRIENGVLITDPVDVTLPFYGNLTHQEFVLREMSIELPLEPQKDERNVRGMVVGYYDLDSFWSYMKQIEFLSVTGQFSCPGIYVAARELADGFPDPETGECTALSSAFHVDAVPAFVIADDATRLASLGKQTARKHR